MAIGLRISARRGFTLVELLVVIAIIGLLMGVLLPALSRARESAHATACLSTERQIGAAAEMYQSTYDGFVPREGSPASAIQPLLIPWNVAFRPFLDDRCSPGLELNDMFEAAPYYRCASRPSPQGGKNSRGHRVQYVVNGFAFLANGQPDERGAADPKYLRGPMRAVFIPAPARMLYIMDFAADPGDVLYTRWLGAGNTDIAIGQFYDAWLARHLDEHSDDYRIGPAAHSGGANALYLDGHAERHDASYFSTVANWDDGWHSKP